MSAVTLRRDNTSKLPKYCKVLAMVATNFLMNKSNFASNDFWHRKHSQTVETYVVANVKR